MSYSASASAFSLYNTSAHEETYSAFGLFIPAQQHPRETHETYEQVFQLFRPSNKANQKRDSSSSSSSISSGFKKFLKGL
ncbi:hypothetical protein AAF712_005254 [Marasmius tenuissimus]|uniref:Uncharacterized protein n=1 Tax=Marasmius tenuissimus TaxID=585030 RepID=A0ABR3A0Z7_9AGAR|nr:hypothetical protein PM082_005582 [Marasmius tenuissimus]